MSEACHDMRSCLVLWGVDVDSGEEDLGVGGGEEDLGVHLLILCFKQHTTVAFLHTVLTL